MRKDRLTLWEWVYIMCCFRREQRSRLFRYAYVSGSHVLISPFAYLEASRFFAHKQALLKKKRSSLRKQLKRRFRSRSSYWA